MRSCRNRWGIVFAGMMAAGIVACNAVAEPALPGDLARILFVKRFAFDANHYYTEYINSTWMPGGNVCVLDLKTGAVQDLVPHMASGVFGRFDLSFDASRIVFDWKSGAQEG